MGLGEIWVCARDGEAGRHIKKIFDEANFFNPVRIVDKFELHRLPRLDGQGPVLVLLDLGLPDERAWEILSAFRAAHLGSDPKTPIVALVDSSTEMLMDRAYDAGVKTYLRKPLTFAEFLARARLLQMRLMIDRPNRAA